MRITINPWRPVCLCQYVTEGQNAYNNKSMEAGKPMQFSNMPVTDSVPMPQKASCRARLASSI